MTSKIAPKSIATWLSVCLTFVLPHMYAADISWTGQDGGEWTEPANWSSGTVPTTDDVVTFDPGNIESYTVNVSAIGRCGGLRFLSGGKFLLNIASNTRIYLKNDIVDLHVADGVNLNISNALVSATHYMTTLRKTGRGSLLFTATGGDGMSGTFWGFFKAWDFAGGTTEFIPPMACPIRSPVTIRSGATLKSASNYLFANNTQVHLEDGALLDLKDATTTYLDGFSGGGTITNVWDMGAISLTNGPYMFSGRVHGDYERNNGARKYFARLSFAAQNDTPSEKFKFILGSSTTFTNVIASYKDASVAPISFAPGIGDFHLYRIIPEGDAALHLNDTDGKPVTLYSDCQNISQLRLSGTGQFCFNRGAERTLTASSLPLIDGFTGELGVRNARMILGDGTESGWPTNLPASVTLRSTYRGDGTWEGLRLNAPTSRTVEIGSRITGDGGVTLLGKVRLLNANLEGGVMYIGTNENGGSDVTISGGDCQLGRYYIYFFNGSVLTVENGAYLGGKNISTRAHYGRPLRHDQVFIYNGDSFTNRTLNVRTGGTVCWGQGIPDRVTVSDGGVFESHRGVSASPCAKTFLWNGGVFRALDYISMFNMNLDGGNGLITHCIGEKGMTLDIRCRDYPYDGGFHKIYFSKALETAPGAASDGGVRRIGAGFLLFKEPLAINGLFDNTDGTLVIGNYPAMLTGEGPLFGTGDFRLGNGRIEVATTNNDFGVNTAITAKIGTGGNFRYNGAGLVCVRLRSDDVVHSYKLGEPVREDRGTLFFSDAASTFDGNVTFTTAPDTASDGRIIEPMFVTTSGQIDFASYAADKIAPYSGYAALANGGTAASAVRVGSLTTVSADTSVPALKIIGSSTTDTSATSGRSVLTISQGATLHVGDGVNPAPLLLNNGGWMGAASIGGAGTLDFGTSEGIVVGSWLGNGRYAARIEAKITGSGGLSLVAPPSFDASGMVLELDGANAYSGETVINGVQAIPGNDAAFSSGPIRIGGGTLAGGCIRFEKPGIKIANSIMASGCGSRFHSTSGETFKNCLGAFVFTSNGEVAGKVDVTAPMRITAYGADVEGTFSNVISGDAIEIGSSSEGTPFTPGKIVFSACNTYTGGTEVIKSTLVLKDGGTAGTGVILLNEATLEIANAERKTVQNAITGFGTIRLNGSATAEFTNLRSDDAAGFSLSLAKRANFIASLDGFSSITTPRTGITKLVVEDGSHLTFTGSVPANVTLMTPEEFSKPGFTVILR